jgi:predicted PurR-regulated permease PerM
MRDHRVDISYKTILFIAGFIALVWALYIIKDVIVLLFVAIIFMSALSPIVEYLERLRIPKVLAIAV